MGTSQSSKGSPGGVPIVPPWVPDPPLTVPPPDAETAPPSEAGQETEPAAAEANVAPMLAATAPPPAGLPPVPIAPAARFGGARRSLGSFARTGDPGDMRRGVGRYVRSGYGGAQTAARRFGGTVSTADALYGALAGVAGGPAPGNTLDPVLLAGRSARQVMDVIVEAVRPADGTQDAEASRASIRDALSELLTKFAEADPLNLSAEQREFVIERFVAIDVYRRFVLDLGKHIQDKASSAASGLARLKQVKDYIKECIAAAFRKLRDSGQRLSASRVNQIVRSALVETMQVFEGYAE